MYGYFASAASNLPLLVNDALKTIFGAVLAWVVTNIKAPGLKDIVLEQDNLLLGWTNFPFAAALAGSGDFLPVRLHHCHRARAIRDVHTLNTKIL